MLPQVYALALVAMTVVFALFARAEDAVPSTNNPISIYHRSCLGI